MSVSELVTTSSASRVVRLALALVTLLGCGEPPGPPPRAEQSLGPMDALAQRFGRLRRRMYNRGYGRAQQMQRTFALEGEGVGIPVDLENGRCTTWIALAGGGLRDLRARLYDGDGRELAVDEARGEGALLHVCPPPLPAITSPHYLELRASEGSGAIVLGAFVSNIGIGEGFEELFDGVVSPPVPFLDVEEALADVRQAMRERGMDVEGEPEFRRMAEGQGFRRAIRLESDRCYVVAALGGEGMEDLDLFLYDASGAEVARDLGPGSNARLEHCPQEVGSGTLEVRAFEGSGAAGVIVFSGPEAAPSVPELDVVEQAAPLAVLGGEIDALVARGLVDPLYLVQDGSLGPGETRTHEVVLGPGCGLLVGAGGPGELDLDLYLVDSEGRAVDVDTRVQRTARVGACPTEQRAYRVTVKAYGRGRYALARARAPEANDLAELRAATARAVDVESPSRRRMSLEEGERARLDVMGCIEAVVGGDDGVEDVDLQLVGPDGELLASDTGPAPWASIRHCPEEGVPVSAALEVVVYRGRGEVLVEWHEAL